MDTFCKKCGGCGEVFENSSVGRTPKYNLVRCIDCDGTGFHKAPLKTLYNPEALEKAVEVFEEHYDKLAKKSDTSTSRIPNCS